jgi:hypothetical protein
VINTEPPVGSAFNVQMGALKANGTLFQKALIHSLEDYLEVMKPGVPVNKDVGARKQYDLWKAISTIAESSASNEFKKLWNILLAYFEEYKGAAFHDRYIFRFSEYWIWNENELAALQRVINLIKLTSNPAERAFGLKQVVLDKTLELGFSDTAKQRIVIFYKK